MTITSKIAKVVSYVLLFLEIYIKENEDLKKHSIKTMCRVLIVSEAGYYKWLTRQSMPYKYAELWLRSVKFVQTTPTMELKEYI